MTTPPLDFAAALAEAIAADAWQDEAFPVQRFDGEVLAAGLVASVDDFARCCDRVYSLTSPPNGAWGALCRLHCSVEASEVLLEKTPNGQMVALARLRYRDPSR